MVIQKDLPIKVSLNQWYAGIHWTKRKKIKDVYALVFKGNYTKPCDVDYDFTFKSRPLDCSNCMAMVKMIEDCLFPDDSNKVVKSIRITSNKGDKDTVKISIYGHT